jgi:sigma-E factor negative regulatory protein RseC
MLEQQGRVVEQSGGIATISIGPVAACPACAAGKGCGAGVFGRLWQRKAVQVKLQSPTDAQPGDVVVVGIPESLFLGLVMRLYLRPLLMGLAGAVAGNYLAARMTNLPGIIDGLSLLLAFAGVGLGLAWIRNPGKDPLELAAGRLLKVLNRPQDAPGCSAKQGGH